MVLRTDEDRLLSVFVDCCDHNRELEVRHCKSRLLQTAEELRETNVESTHASTGSSMHCCCSVPVHKSNQAIIDRGRGWLLEAGGGE